MLVDKRCLTGSAEHAFALFEFLVKVGRKIAEGFRYGFGAPEKYA
jgi:hypothetical protein